MGWREIMAGGPVPDDEVAEQSSDGEAPQPPGWYRDPNAPDIKRYWDGEQWSQGRHERAKPPKPTGKANRLAVAALVLACLAPLFVGGILGTVFGMVALDEIDESEGEERGAGIAKWAIGIGFVNILVSCAFIVLMVAVIAD